MTSRLTRRQADLMNRLLQLFLTEGFRHHTLDDIAGKLRCSKTTLYALAPSKEQLAVEVVKLFFRQSTTAVESAVAAADSDTGRIEAYLGAASAQLRRASREFIADMGAFAPAREVYERNTRFAAERIATIIADGIRNGSFRDAHVDFTAAVAAQVMLGIQRGDIGARAGLSDGDGYAHLADLLLHSLRTDQPRPDQPRAAHPDPATRVTAGRARTGVPTGR